MFNAPRLRSRLIAAPALLLLFGCAPHPATGVWLAAPEADDSFVRLELGYDGRALLYAVGEKEAGRRCFWGGESAGAVVMTCKPAHDMEAEEHYHLSVAEDGSAALSRDGAVVARFARQPTR